MGTTRFDIKEVETLLTSLQDSITGYKESADTLNTSYEQYVNNDTFKGDGADAAKMYMNEIEIGILEDILDLHQLLFDMHVHMRDSFKENVDAASDARIDTDAITEVSGDFNQFFQSFEECAKRIEDKASSVASKFGHLADFVVPDSTTTKDSYKSVIGEGEFLDQCIDKFETFDQNETAYEKSTGFDQKLKDICDRLGRLDANLGAMEAFDPDFGVYELYKLIYQNATTASAKFISYIKGMQAYLIGVQKSCSTCEYDPVNMCSGNYINEHVDIKLGGRFNLEFRRFYNALSQEEGPLGTGWTHSFDERILINDLEDNESVVATGSATDAGTGEYIRVRFGDGSEGSFVKKGDFYLEEHGKPGILEVLKDGRGFIIRQDNGSYEKFDKRGRLVSLGDNDGENTVLFYEELSNEEYRLSKTEAKNGNSLMFEYDENSGKIKTITDHTGRVVQYSYEGDRLVETIEADGATRRYTYDKSGRIKDVVNPRGIVSISNTYDEKGRTIRQDYPDGSLMTYEYDDDNRTVTATEQNGNKVIYTHDELERHTKTTYYDGEERYTYNLRNQKTSITDKRGNTTHFAYDRKGHLTKYIDALGNKTSITYNADGKPMAVKGPKGEEYRYSYNMLGKLSQVTNPLGETNKVMYKNGNVCKTIDANGNETLFDYDERGNIKTVTDPDGVVTSYEYDSLNRVTASISADGVVTSYEYDNADRIIKATDAFGNTREYTYDQSGKVTSVKEKDGTVKNFEIDIRGHVSKVVDEDGRETRITYNSMGKQEEVLLPNGGLMKYEYDPLMRLTRAIDPEGRIRTYSYDPNGNVTEEYLGDIRVSAKEYDALGRVIKATDALGHAKKFAYDENGKVLSVTDAQGNQYTRDYDVLGRVVKETDPLGNITVYSYTKLGNIESITDPAGRERRFEYTAAGKLSAVYFCGRLVQSLVYDNCGRVSKRTFADGYEILYTYDALNHVSKVQASDGRTVSYEHDAMGRVISLKDGNSTTKYTYTATGRLRSVVDALGNETAYTYDALDNLQSIHRTEGLVSEEERNGDYFPTVGRDGHVTLYSYNLAGQLTTVTDALGQEETYEYDQYGRLKTKTDRDNYATTYDYNDLGSVTRVGYGDGRTVEFAYDELDHVRQIKDWLGITTLENDIFGRLVKVTDYQNRTVSYEYGSIGEKTKLTYPDGRSASYIYDEEGKLSSVTGNGEETRYSYDDLGRLTEKFLPNGVTMGYSYFPGGQLESMTSTDKEGQLDKYLYHYDNAGLISGIDRDRRGLEAVSGQYQYQYDAIGRLLKSSFNGQTRSSYEYDAYGNRKSFFENEVSTTYTYDVLDRLSEAKELSSSQAVVKTYDYDNRGNQTKEYVDGLLSKAFTFDATNMLSKVVDTEKGEQENQYNGLGYRVASGRPDEKIEYLCDLSRDYYNLLERTVNGEKESFVYDNNVVSMSREGQNYYYLQDELGSPMYMTGTDGEVLSSYAFDDFGRNIDPTTGRLREHAYTKNGNIIQPFAFTGYQEDEISGLKFAQARFYSAENGRFVGEDQVKGKVIKPDSINHYLYCFNDSRNLVDGNGKTPNAFPTLMNPCAPQNIPFETYKLLFKITGTYIAYKTGALGRYVQECEKNAPTGKTLEELQASYSTDLPDYTEMIDDWLEKQEKHFDMVDTCRILSGPLAPVVRVVQYADFALRVRTFGKMDVKQEASWNKAFAEYGVPFPGKGGLFIYHGQVMDPATLGNVTYSYVGSKYFSDFALYSGGAFVQIKNYHWQDLPFMYFLPCWGDMDEDKEAIALGIKWRKEGFCDG